MASKRKLEFSDVASVEQPVDSASVHGVYSEFRFSNQSITERR